MTVMRTALTAPTIISQKLQVLAIAVAVAKVAYDQGLAAQGRNRTTCDRTSKLKSNVRTFVPDL
jgi:hypothetical protein